MTNISRNISEHGNDTTATEHVDGYGDNSRALSALTLAHTHTHSGIFCSTLKNKTQI